MKQNNRSNHSLPDGHRPNTHKPPVARIEHVQSKPAEASAPPPPPPPPQQQSIPWNTAIREGANVAENIIRQQEAAIAELRRENALLHARLQGFDELRKLVEPHTADEWVLRRVVAKQEAPNA